MPKCPFCEKPISVGTTSCPYCHAPITGMQPPTSDDLEARVRALLDQRQKIEAIKLYREETGSSLLDAKNAVEASEAGRGLHIPEKNIPEGLEGDVLRLLGEGKKIPAIKLYRERMGVGLKEAKEAVEALGERHGIVGRGGGCLGIVLVLVGFAMVLTLATIESVIR
jgi:large subunit ribosomal protein L7/L12